MSETKHTPGPWKYSAYFSGYDSFHRDFSLNAGDVEIIGGCGCCGSPTISSEADARLIAAAPELLEALEALQPYVLHLPDGAPIKETIRAAIAKAKGEQP